MNALAAAQRKYDREEPQDTASFFRKDEIEFDKEIHRPRFSTVSVTDSEVEQFIADLDAASNKDIFLENTIGALPHSASNEFSLHIAVAHQWVRNKEAVGETIGPVFWQWAKNATYLARS